ncbi:50S ribosomal protein L24 [bacterium (Candidatus Gribaldobacteria) CG_4_9_14_3_um_filter_36_15]|uniref:Large ribosomal subunit protein uL24 n=4 Tax=Candidatus Gribaldobacteria TaxID=2798536 RepID=A0A2M7VL47_9BACT|nr:MAG: 50S ribosomal protein L24 [Parcubacteria group bacterium CG2_30_36_21]PIR91302.1 MAG: 50S ribosomal protein L24 [bacterium (Candidatus Gribaldobacteria) CG10_big_fil_rev_8_21_14_0_10_37_46]PIV14104.1 MAG: 50S ribosomal protein L24 [bacterium (Candidatus Gribaldobacteria) CG03_land_8_20_14_0_80_36_40]PJA02558.1 MAG: 50S ribosomal protein L24 [bacterium (Candidatus Gribaldobacteria) CG_4_10_14_0_2_um_filter_36_18]PJB09208.1 MAG: 50S ribosomal protein L24 [bacterium (Candidatus Gribaldobac
MKIKKGDQVLIIKGKDRGKKEKVLRSFPEKNQVLVEGINIKKLHKRPKKTGEKGQVVEVSSPIYISNLRLICPKCGKSTRVGYKTEEKTKTRICKKCGEEI